MKPEDVIAAIVDRAPPLSAKQVRDLKIAFGTYGSLSDLAEMRSDLEVFDAAMARAKAKE